MKTADLFKFTRSSSKLNEGIQKVFGKKLNLESFDLDQLQDARNKLRTQLSQIRGQSGFNENIENDAFHQAQWMLDAINAEIAERDQHIIESDVEEGAMKDLATDVEDFLVGWQDAAVDHEEYGVQGELVDLQKQFNSDGDIDALYNELRKRAAGDEFYKSLAMFFKKEFKNALGKSTEDVEEGQTDVDYELHQIAASDDEEELIDAMEGLKGAELQIALEDMMSELKDELAAKGMNDVMRDEDKMIELLMDKVIEEYGEDGEEYDYGPMDSSDDADALKSAGFGNDEDYESIQFEKAPPGAKAERMVKHIKKGYADDGKLTKKEKSIAYATAWKHHNKKKDESVQQGDEMTTLREGEVQQASAIVTAKTMVDRVGRWIEELSGMENETLLQLGDSIRDEMGQEQARTFIEQTAPAIQQALEALKGTRDTLSTSVRSLASGEQPADMLGSEPAMGGEEDMTEPAPDAGMDMAAEPAGDEFAAAEPAAGGAEEAGREQRESIERQNNLLKVLAG